MTRLGSISIGTIAFTFLTSVYFATFEPTSWADAQFVVMYVAIIPIGIVASLVVLFANEQSRRGEKRDAAAIATSGAVAIAIMGVAADVVPAVIVAGALVVWAVTIWSQANRRMNGRADR